MIIGSAEVTHKLAAMVNWFNEQYGVEIKGLDFHPRTVRAQKEIYPFTYAAWCFLAILKSLEPASIFAPRFAPSDEEPRFMDHLYRREFFNEEKSAETAQFSELVLQHDRKRSIMHPKYFSAPTLLEELLPAVIAEAGTMNFSIWFEQQLLVENNFTDPHQKSVFPEIQTRPVSVSARCNVLPGERDQAEILVGEEKVHTKGLGIPFASQNMYIGGYLGRKPLVILCKTKVDKIKLNIREDLKEIVRLIGADRLLLVTEHEIWRKYFRSSLGVPAENICIDNKWNDIVIKEFVERHRKKFEA